MKWRVDIEYEDGSFTEPRRIAFQAVYDGEPYYGYDTKKEALEAFCVGQVAMESLRKEREAEQKEWKHFAEATDEQKKKADELKGQTSNIIYNGLRGGNSHWGQKEEGCSPEELEKRFGGWNEAIREAHKSPIEKQFEKIEQRLTEIEGVLSSMGSPDYDLRKKVEELEKKIETIFQNTRENHAEMFERVCGLERRLRNY